MESALHDVLSNIPLEAVVFGEGRVTLMDCCPRLVPIENNTARTPEFAIARAARVSTGLGSKTVGADTNLIRFLYENNHTSPFEQVSVTFHLRVPKFVAIQLLRHRTAKVNEFSQRYSEVPDAFYCPGALGIIRVPDPLQKQVSQETADQEKIGRLTALCLSIETKVQDLYGIYKELLANGMAREQSRTYLPIGVYTEIYFQMDLNNLCKFFSLRLAPDAQYETREFVQAMYHLCLPLFPVTLGCLEDRLNGLVLTRSRLDSLKAGKSPKSERQRVEWEQQRKELAEIGYRVQAEELCPWLTEV